MSGAEKMDDAVQSAEQQNETRHDLQSIREARGITLNDIFRVSRVSVINLEAIEKANYHLLPTPFIAKSFIKTYAKAIGVDAETIIHQYDLFLKTRDNVPVEEKTGEPPQDKRKQTKVIGLSLLGAAIVCIVVYLVYSFYPMLNDWGSMQNVKTSPPVADAPPPVDAQKAPAEKNNLAPVQPVQSAQPVQQSQQAAQPSSVPPPLAVATGPSSLVIEATGFTWIKIAEDNKTPLEILLKPGEKIERSASRFELDIGNAGGTNIVYQGKSLGVLGKPGQVVHLKLP